MKKKALSAFIAIVMTFAMIGAIPSFATANKCNTWLCFAHNICACGTCEPGDWGDISYCTCIEPCEFCGITFGYCDCDVYVKSCPDCGRGIKGYEADLGCDCELVPCGGGCGQLIGMQFEMCDECSAVCSICGQMKSWCGEGVNCEYAACCGRLLADCRCADIYCGYCEEEGCIGATSGNARNCPKFRADACPICGNPFICQCGGPSDQPNENQSGVSGDQPNKIAMLGDVNINQKIEIFDALEILKYLVGSSSLIAESDESFNAALITGGLEPTIFDAMEILKCIVGI